MKTAPAAGTADAPESPNSQKEAPMSILPVEVPTDAPPVVDLKAEASKVYRQSLDAEMPLSGDKLGAMFDRSGKWGREVIRDVKKADGPAKRTRRRTPRKPVQSAPVDPSGDVAGEGSNSTPLDPSTAGVHTEAAEVHAEGPADPRPGVGKAVIVGTFAAVLLVAGVALTTSFSHMHDLAKAAGEEWRSALFPLSVDGLVVAAGLVLWARSKRGEKGGLLPWSSLITGVVVSILANIGTVDVQTVLDYSIVRAAIVGWAPVAAFLAVHLLFKLARMNGEVDQ